MRVEVKNNNVDRALSKFKRKVDEDGRLQTYRQRTHYEKPCQKRNRKRMEGTLRHNKKRQRDALPPKASR